MFPASAKGSKEPAPVVEPSQPEEPVIIKVVEKTQTSFFYGINESVLADVYTGSPESLNRAAASMRKASVDYSDPEKVLLYVAAEIMKIAWPTETVSWEVPLPPSDNAYVGAVSSARKGIYDSSTGNSDFLTLTLPSLVLLLNLSRDDYYAEAEQSLSLAMTMRPDSVLAAYLAGTLYRRMGQPQKAFECYKVAAESAPGCMQASYALAECLRDKGEYGRAFSLVEPFTAKYPGNISLLKLCAETSFAMGNFSVAELYVARVLQQNPSDSGYVLFRARILVEEGEFIKAASLLDVYARTDSESKGYLLLRARVQRDWNKNLRGAVETMSQAVSKYADDEDVILFAAELASASGEKIEGKSAGELAALVLEKNPDSEKARMITVADLVNNKKWNEAYAVNSKLMRAAGASAESRYTQIKICLALGRTDEAWNLAAEQYEKSPSDEQAVQAYLEVLFATGRLAESQDLINRLLPSANSRMKSFLYYRKSYLSKNEQTVLADLRSSLIANPRNSDALYRLYTIYFEKKDYRKAQYYLKQVVALNPNNEEYLRKNAELEKLL